MKRLLTLAMASALMCTSFHIPACAESGDVVTLDVFYASIRPMNEATDLTRQYIRDTLGVDINLIQGDATNFNQQLALYVSSGDIPDIVLCDYSVWMDYAQTGA